MRWFLVAAAVGAAGCSVKPSCPGGDVGCLFSSLSVANVEGGPRLELVAVDAAKLVGADAGTLALSGPAALEIDPGGETLSLAFEDPFGCRPAYCFSACPGGVACLADARCTSAVKDGLMRGVSFHWLELGSQPEQTTQFTLIVTPVAAPGCPEDVAQRLQAGDSTVRVGRAAVIDVSALRRLKTPVIDAGTCLQASTLVCTALGISGSRSRCITRTEYESATGLPLPSAPAPDGTIGCFDEQNQVLLRPCMPTSTCRVGKSCGGSTVAGGVCNP